MSTSASASNLDFLTEDLIATWVFVSKLLLHNPPVRTSLFAALKANKIAILVLQATKQTLATGEGSVELQGVEACLHDNPQHDRPFMLPHGKIINLTASSVLVCIVTSTNNTQVRQMPVQMFSQERMDFALTTWLIPSSIPALYEAMK